MTIHNLYESKIDLVKQYILSKGNSIKTSEIEDLIRLISELKQVNDCVIDYNLYDYFFVGYSIPRISKEFDLLRFGENYVLNIELKRVASMEDVRKQLQQNRYYLKFLKKEIKLYSFVNEENKLYRLNDINELEITDFEDLYHDLLNQNLSLYENTSYFNIDQKFHIKNYLVSPFNSTAKFANGQYFLTDHQKQVKKQIFDYIYNENSKFNIIGIKGNPGTGKTLLTYDIAREFVEDSWNILIIHCGKLNEGHKVLRDEYNYNIISVKDIENVTLNKFDLIIVDESQRIRETQFNLIIESVKKGKNVIFAFDPNQCLSYGEIRFEFEKKLNGELTTSMFNLSNKIRTNPEIAQFVKCLFNKKHLRPNNNIRNLNKYVKIEFFNSNDDALKYVNHLKRYGWKIIKYTTSIYNEEHIDEYEYICEENSHDVIGQEFNNIAVILNEKFRYYKGKLESGGTYYDLNGMLFQNITRAREKLCLVIVNNEELFNYCIEILREYD